MPSTTNFNWTTPADTDLVKDGAAAIRTLGNGIDTSLVDLKGGTTGQVLSKASNTDLDFTWTNGGDITEVAAGVGISGGGTSGAVTITNSMATAIDAKGDLVAGTGADAFARLAVGANNTVLTADSSTATGLKWATPAAPSFVGCRAKITTGQTITNNATSVVTFNAEDFDTDGFHDNVTNNSRFTIPSGKGGKYRVESSILFTVDDADLVAYSIYKNGNALYEVRGRTGGSGFQSATIHTILDLVPTDYIQFYIFQQYSTGSTQNVEPTIGGTDCSWASIEYLGA